MSEGALEKAIVDMEEDAARHRRWEAEDEFEDKRRYGAVAHALEKHAKALRSALRGAPAPDVLAAVEYALATDESGYPGWRVEDLIGVLRGPARLANGFIVAVCEKCRKPEYVEGLHMTEVIEAGDDLNPAIVGGGLCASCLVEKNRGR